MLLPTLHNLYFFKKLNVPSSFSKQMFKTFTKFYKATFTGHAQRVRVLIIYSKEAMFQGTLNMLEHLFDSALAA